MLTKQCDDERKAKCNELFKSTIFFVEATRFEQLTLWCHYSKVAYEKGHDCNNGTRYDFNSISEYPILIGYIDKKNKRRPVYVRFSFFEMDGFIVCFYRPSSQFSDAGMIYNWIKNRYPITFPVKWDIKGCDAMTGADGFQLVLDHIDFLKQSKQHK